MTCNPNLNDLLEHADEYQKYETEQKITWCGGCGNYGIQNALRRAITLENLGREGFILCFDVGCSGNGSDKFHANTIHGLHGRVLPLAGGVAMARPDLQIFAEAGDGATFSEGVGHFIHAVRSDYPVVFLHHNNQNYALTTGQASSLTPCGTRMSAAPDGVWTPPLRPLQLALSLNPSFVARSMSADVDHMTEMIRAGIAHNGFAFIDIMQTCPTYNRKATNSWYLDRLKDVSNIENYDEKNIAMARKLADTPEDEAIYTGIIYKNPRANYNEQMPQRKGITTNLTEEVKHYDVEKFMQKLV